jgi:hypothetical protein
VQAVTAPTAAHGPSPRPQPALRSRPENKKPAIVGGLCLDGDTRRSHFFLIRALRNTPATLREGGEQEVHVQILPPTIPTGHYKISAAPCCQLRRAPIDKIKFARAAEDKLLRAMTEPAHHGKAGV